MSEKRRFSKPPASHYNRVMKYWLIPLAAVFVALLIYNNHHLTVSRYELPGITDARIVQLSDLHWALFGRDNCRLVALVAQQKSDIIVITGDLLDKRIPNRVKSLSLLRQLAAICPVYYVRGNHEVYLNDRQYLEDVGKTGAVYLENEKSEIMGMTLIGLDDASVCGSRDYESQKAFIDWQLDRLAGERHAYTILLSHQPQHLDSYGEHEIDLVLCGHVHGGQFRLPFIGGIYGPQQGLFPKYDSGLHYDNGTAMVLSRGLGNSLFPFRLNNFPEIVVIDLKKREA